jgi:hypothetical protein
MEMLLTHSCIAAETKDFSTLRPGTSLGDEKQNVVLLAQAGHGGIDQVSPGFFRAPSKLMKEPCIHSLRRRIAKIVIQRANISFLGAEGKKHGDREWKSLQRSIQSMRLSRLKPVSQMPADTPSNVA